ncbi:MAG: histidine phosphatase family protein [Alphaproteobacteria bacterium]|nr:histidine phosphatase family protein [Alphaproteobacteria bacterium]
MTTLYLVRHGEAAASYADALDPGLSALGREQAGKAAKALAPKGPLALVSSPLARARETAAPLADMWGSTVSIEEAVAEIPSPGLKLGERREWLRTLMMGNWADTSPEIRAWCDGVVQYLLNCREDTVVFSHFVAINVAVGRALGTDAVVAVHPANASIWTLTSDGRALSVAAKGEEVALTIVR